MKGECFECSRRWTCEIDPADCDEWPDPAPMTNADRIRAMPDAEKRQALIDYFSEWADIGDSYIFDLTRVKTAFAVGTVGLDDFEEWGESRIEELVDEFIKWLQQPAEGE